MTVIAQARNGHVHGIDSTRMEVHACANCGVLHGVPESFLDQRRQDGGTYYCPNGHALSYHETEADRERKRAAILKRRLEMTEDARARTAAERDQAKASARAEKAAKTRIKRSRQRERERVANGVCPCCNRTFRNLARHMASQHPDHVGSGPE